MWNDPHSQDDATYNYEPVQQDVSLEKPAESSSPMFKEPILGMTPLQRLVVALFLLVDVCILGILFLIAFDKLALF